MFKWICLGVAVVFLGFIGWVAYDIRNDIHRSAETVQKSGQAVNEHLPAIVQKSHEVSAVVTENLPTIVEKTRTTTDTLAELSEDVKQLKELAGLTGGTRDQNLVAYAESVLNLIDQSGGTIGLKKTLGGSGLKNQVPAKEWVVGARKEAVFLTLVVKSSAASHDDFRIDRSQLSPRVADAELPIDAALAIVDVVRPRLRFLAQF
ncbi:MAG TPA: hypothetical protein VHR66_16315, partial [Gemmataceae bacterium]|nr:hypothetical protein [Gemmataceae bacterium]